MAKGKKSFLLYCDAIHTVKKLSDEQAGRLFKHLLAYVNDEDPKTDDVLIDVVFEPIKQQLKRDLVKWANEASFRVDRAKKAGLASAKARQLRPTKVNSLVKNELRPTNSTVSVNDSVNVNDSDNVNKESSTKTEVKPQYGNVEINKMLEALKGKVGVEAFVDSSMERNFGKHCVRLIGSLGKDEFVRRLDILLQDSFHAKNCNKIKYIYNNIKGFREPESRVTTII